MGDNGAVPRPARKSLETARAARTSPADRIGGWVLANRVARRLTGDYDDLRLRSSRWLESATHGGRRYEHLLRVDFETFNREKRTRERFFLVCATDGPLARVPVFLEYQPKWWFKASGGLDESEVFPY